MGTLVTPGLNNSIKVAVAVHGRGLQMQNGFALGFIVIIAFKIELCRYFLLVLAIGHDGPLLSVRQVDKTKQGVSYFDSDSGACIPSYIILFPAAYLQSWTYFYL